MQGHTDEASGALDLGHVILRHGSALLQILIPGGTCSSDMAEVTASDRPTHRRQRRTARAVRMATTPMVDLRSSCSPSSSSPRACVGWKAWTSWLRWSRAANQPIRRSPSVVGGRDTINGYAGAFDPDVTVPERYGHDQMHSPLRSVKDTAGLALFIKPRPTTRYADVLGLVDACNLAGRLHYAVLESAPAGAWNAALLPLTGPR